MAKELKIVNKWSKSILIYYKNKNIEGSSERVNNAFFYTDT
jgi:hypothetical protein